MAELITKEQAIKCLNAEIKGQIESNIDLSQYKREFQEFADMVYNAQKKAIEDLNPVEEPTADVIERSRYEQLNKEADALSKAYQEEHEKYKQLRLNVAKAIEEMEIEYINLDYYANKLLGASHGVRKSIEILKRNIGE